MQFVKNNETAIFRVRFQLLIRVLFCFTTTTTIGDVDGCAVQPISQSQFTPLPEALCWVIWELNLAERSTALDDVTAALGKNHFFFRRKHPLTCRCIRILTRVRNEVAPSKSLRFFARRR